MRKRAKKSKESAGQVGNAPQHAEDSALGMKTRICRRDFLNSTLLASGSVLLGSQTPLELLAQQSTWGGYTGVGDYAGANGHTMEVMLAAHTVRDGAFDAPPAAAVDTGEVFDLVVAGGGLSGLAAALYFKDQAKPQQTCLVLENHPIFGGQARRNEFIVDGQRLIAPQGSNWFWIPNGSKLVEEFYARVGVDPSQFKYQTWDGPPPAMPLSRTSWDHLRNVPSPPNFGFYFGEKFGQRPGKWVVDPWNNLEHLPISPGLRSDFAKYLKAVNEYHRRGRINRKELCNLDGVTAEQVLMERYGISREFIRLFCAPCLAAAMGVGPDAASGTFYQGVFGSGNEITRHSFPGGNTGFARHAVKTLIPDSIPGPRTLEAVCRGRINFAALDRRSNPVRIRLGSTAVRVEHGGQPENASFVRVVYTRHGKAYRLKARTVIMAGGGWMTKHVVRDLPSTLHDAYNQFNYSATLVANVALRNWRFLHKLGLSGGMWFEGFGFWTEVRTVATFGSAKPAIGPDSPTVLSVIVPFYYPGLPTAEQGNRGRAEILSTSFRDFERKVRVQFAEVFSMSGFNARRDIAGIILNRWGHHYISAQPGFMCGEDGKPSPREVLRKMPFGRIAFANTDLTGDSGHDLAIREGHRAATQILARL